jgi:hypothetical protein
MIQARAIYEQLCLVNIFILIKPKKKSRRNGKNLKYMISNSPVTETPVPCDPFRSQFSHKLISRKVILKLYLFNN